MQLLFHQHLSGALSEVLSKKGKTHTDRERLVCQKLQTEPSGGSTKGSTPGGDQVHHVSSTSSAPAPKEAHVTRPKHFPLSGTPSATSGRSLYVTGQLRSLLPAPTILEFGVCKDRMSRDSNKNK